MKEKKRLIRDQNNSSLQQWHDREKTALELLQVAGELRFDKSVELILFRRDIYDTRPSVLIDNHKHGHNYVDQIIQIDTTLALAKAIAQLPQIAPARIDLGILGAEWLTTGDQYPDLHAFIGDKLRAIIAGEGLGGAAKDVVLYGFGRIGRLLARRIVTTTGKGEQLRLKAIVVRPKMKSHHAEATKRADLLREDSVHGNFPGRIEVAADGRELIINGNRIQLIFAQQPEDIDYTEYGINEAMVIDNTGVWRDRAGLSRHLRPGINQVMLTAPGKDVPNIVYGANENQLQIPGDAVFSAASCTTNAIVPIVKVVDDHWGIDSGHIETIHSYTNDQNLLDNFHKKPRRGRAAPLNMVLTSTGAATAVSKVLPHLQGRLSGNAVRVPTPNVSLVILHLEVRQSVTAEAVNAALRQAALHGPFVEQIHYSSSPDYVSTQAVGMTSTSVVDAPSTIVGSSGQRITIYAWYDNEFGYACQVVRLAKHAAKVRRHVYY
ncbi:MAG: glyceraldehyde-3-phosphate dehydrogenase [Bacteroidota bacterium]